MQRLYQPQQQFDRNSQNLIHYNNRFSTRTVEFRDLLVVFVFLVAQQKAVVAAQLKSVAEQKIRIERWERKMVEGRLYLFVVPGFMLPRSMWLCNCAVTVRDWSKVVLMAWNSSWILVEVVVFCVVQQKAVVVVQLEVEVVQESELVSGKWFRELQLLMCLICTGWFMRKLIGS